MSTSVKITGAIDRHEPDPAAPTDQLRAWIGFLSVLWTGDGPRENRAAILEVATGRGTGDRLWGASVLVLQWIGDPPPPAIAQTAYDYVRDGGPEHRRISVAVDSQPRSEAQPSYRMSRAN
jgi:hypothetical protein